MNDFRPPKLNKNVMTLCKFGLPLELWRSQIEINVVANGLQKYHELDGKHVVIISNHSNQYDPEVVFAFSKIVGEDFHFLCAREVFDWVFGSVGWWFQSLGCYSVMRGTADVESFKMTRDIIAEGAHRLVIFPEGEVTRQPDLILPVRSGSPRLIFQGQQELLQRKPSEAVYVQPMAIRWIYKHDITGWLEVIMRLIESQLGIHARRKSLPERVYAAADAMLTTIEREYFCKHQAELDFEERIVRLREEILHRVGTLVGVEPPESGNHLVWLRRVHNTIYDFVHNRPLETNPFALRLHHQEAKKLERFIDDCSRIQQLVGVEPPRHRRPMTQERLAAIIGKLERQVLGFVLPKGPRVALVGIGEPFSMLDFYPQFLADEHRAVELVADLMSQRLQGLIDRLDEGHPDRLGQPPHKIKSDGNFTIEIGQQRR